MIQFRRLAALLVGAWLAAGAFMDVTAIGNFHAVNRFLANPGVASAELVHQVGKDNARLLLRGSAAESNAWLFEQWEWVQLGLGLALVLILLFGERPPKLLIGIALLMIGIVLVQRFAITPVITGLGRAIDFLPAGAEIPERKRFWAFHGVYSAIELLKLALAAVIAGFLVVRRKPHPEMFAREGGVIDAIPAGKSPR